MQLNGKHISGRTSKFDYEQRYNICFESENIFIFGAVHYLKREDVHEGIILQISHFFIQFKYFENVKNV